MIAESSRYRHAPVVYSNDATRGVQRAMWVPPVTFEQVAYSLYMVVAGDRLDTLAYNIYGDANLWWHIADANPQINYPGPLAPGQMIRIPN